VSGPLSPERWRRVEEIFESARGLPAGERARHVRQASGGDEDVAREVDSLLAALEDGGVELTPPDTAELERWMRTGADALVGRTVGDCTLERLVGEGGMGLVYEARQDPPGRDVAVKILGVGLATEERLRRFRQEARVLGRLQHPAIAQVYSAGTHDAGAGRPLPYFVMEYVPEARPITEWVRAHDLGVRERLALFARVCRAVHFGHVKGVIHRDLKPANILVGADGEPKVIDFGVARAVGRDEEEERPRTRTGHLVGTVPYMSPEQLDGADGGLDVRSDVYALGVVLYETLTAHLPYDLESLTLLELIGAIRERPPVPARRWLPGLPRDVEVILAKALAKEPEARYESAAELAQDVERFLAHEPIRARRPSLAHQVRLFARRNRVAFVAIVAGLLALVGGLVGVSLFAAQEARLRRAADVQRARAEDLLGGVTGFVPWVLRRHGEELADIPGTTAVRAELARKAGALLEKLAVREGDEPSLRRSVAETRAALGDVLGGRDGPSLGHTQEAIGDYQAAIAMFDALAAAHAAPRGAEPDARRAAQVRLALAFVRMGEGDRDAARTLLARAAPVLQAWAQASPDEPAARMAAYELATLRGHAAWFAGADQEALAHYRRALEVVEQAGFGVGGSRAQVWALVNAHLDVGTTLLALKRPKEAAPHMARVSALAREIEKGHPGTGLLQVVWQVHLHVGEAARDGGDLEKAHEELQHAVTLAVGWRQRDPQDRQAYACETRARQELAGTLELQAYRHQKAAASLDDAARAQAEAARADQARKDALAERQKALALLRRWHADEPADRSVDWDLRVALVALVKLETRMGHFEDARAHAEEAVRLNEAAHAARPDRTEDVFALTDAWFTRGFVEHVLGAYTPGRPPVERRAALEAARTWYAKALDLATKRVAQGNLPRKYRRLPDAYRRQLEDVKAHLAKIGGR
jgi:tetratricopeptide (TPR) repeat protein